MNSMGMILVGVIFHYSCQGLLDTVHDQIHEEHQSTGDLTDKGHEPVARR